MPTAPDAMPAQNFAQGTTLRLAIFFRLRLSANSYTMVISCAPPLLAASREMVMS